MLAQNFKSAADLGITDEEHRSLVLVLGMFEREEIKPDRFDMAVVSCGSAACIMGWCQTVGGEHLFPGTIDLICATQTDLYQGLFLFGDQKRFGNRNPSHAANAIRSYLTTGDARWDLAVA